MPRETRAARRDGREADKQSCGPAGAAQKKGGHGKGNWGKPGEADGDSGINDPKDPNFEEADATVTP